jgi:hypothetical protein
MTVERIGEYIQAQRANLESIQRLPHFAKLIPLVDQLYGLAFDLTPRDSPARYGRFLLLCHRSFLSAAILIGQGQPEDAAPITRRAIEITKVCLGSKTNDQNAEKWTAYEKREARWKARLAGEKPRFLPPIKLDLPIKHEILEQLETQIGILSDTYVHFTPEFYNSQNWKDQDDVDSGKFIVYLSYFTSNQQTLERELILFAEYHVKMLFIFDECLNGAFGIDGQWRQLVNDFSKIINSLKAKYREDYHVEMSEK